MADIVHRISFKAPPSKVYQALTTLPGLAGWWTEEVEGDPRTGGQILFTFRTPDGEVKGQATARVAGQVPDSEVRWDWVAGPAEWVGGQCTFDLVPDGDRTTLLFGHRGWREVTDFTAHCSMKWATFLLSLRQHVETGDGRPAPRDLKIDNWN